MQYAILIGYWNKTDISGKVLKYKNLVYGLVAYQY